VVEGVNEEKQDNVDLKMNTKKSGWLIRTAMVLVIGLCLYYCLTNLPLYRVLFIAAVIHIIEEVVRGSARWVEFSEVWEKRVDKLSLISLVVSFSLYAYVVMQLWGEVAIVSILVLGGVVEAVRTWSKPRLAVSLFIAFFALFCSVFTSTVPNVLLMEKDAAAESAEEHKFFLRGFTSEDERRKDGVIVRQEPGGDGGIFGSNVVFVFRGHHTRLSVLPFPVWKTVRYEMGDVPAVKIKALSEGHGDSTGESIEVTGGAKNVVGQFTRICGVFENLPKDNSQLYLRVLIRPDIFVDPITDKRLQKWHVQPHEISRSGNRFRDSAELRLEYDNGSDREGRWYVDGFFGAPQDAGWPFAIRALITWKEFKRGEAYGCEVIDEIQARLKPSVRRSTETTLRVVRREKVQ